MLREQSVSTNELPRIAPQLERTTRLFSKGVGEGSLELGNTNTNLSLSVNEAPTPTTRKISHLMQMAEIEQFKENKWFCCSRTSPTFVKYLVQVSFSCIVMAFSITMLATKQENREIYLNLLMLIIGIFIQNPKIENE